MGFDRVIERVRLRHKIRLTHQVLMDCVVGIVDAPLQGQGILLRWALDFLLQEVDKEANKLAEPRSSFHSPDNWSWDSLEEFSLRSQQSIAIQRSPIIWSILVTVAISKDRRRADHGEEGERDPWQVMLMVNTHTCYRQLKLQ